MERIVTERTIVQACRCQSRFCERCAVSAAIPFRERLPIAIGGWRKILFLTLTLHQPLFKSPQQAYDYIRQSRAISRLMRELRKRKLIGRHYVGVLEVHKSGWPHWHVCVDALKFLDPKLLQELWGRFRPKSAGQYVPVWNAQGKLAVPPLGWVKARGSVFKSPEHMTNYLCKYITKAPEGGWPYWIMQYEGSIHRHFVSKGFWIAAGLQEPKPVQVDVKKKQTVKLSCVWSCPVKKTIEEKVRRCGDSCLVRRVVGIVSESSAGEITERSYCLGRVGLSWLELLRTAGRLDEGGGRSMDISPLFGRELVEQFAAERIQWS